MLAAHCVCFVFFFSFRTKDERASYRTKDRFLHVNYLHGLKEETTVVDIELIPFRFEAD